MDRAFPTTQPEVSVIIPARNEEACLRDCLQSLVSQDGVDFEVIVVDDQSTDETKNIAKSFAGVRVISSPPLPAGWTGKNNAVVAGMKEARGEWFLFTDADTVHAPGSLARAIAEAKQYGAELLSYSPEQIAVTFWEMAVLPVVFAELARQYPPSTVSDPTSPIAAANGQYILVRRETYDTVGGHAAIADNLLEDVALARAVKGVGRKIRFRYAADAVRTRMYRNFSQLCEGWTKNLALLFPRAGLLGVKFLAMWILGWGLFLLPFTGIWNRVGGIGRPWWISLSLAGILFLTIRLRRANFTWDMDILGALAGMPVFAYLLLRSALSYKGGSVTWKGRMYSDMGGRERKPDVPGASHLRASSARPETGPPLRSE